MKKLLKLACIIGIIAVCSCSCNKKCTCTTTGIPEYEGEIVYEEPNSKKACEAYQDNQNERINAIGGQVTCVYE